QESKISNPPKAVVNLVNWVFNPDTVIYIKIITAFIVFNRK
ncbi:18266_t:CDS:1, partial [Dentiscutata erythropus]